MAVSTHTSQRFPGLIGKKYTKMTPVNRDWDFESLVSRGVVYNEHGSYVARPFEKFFNFEEVLNCETLELTELGKMLKQYPDRPMLYPNTEGPYRVMDKLDGSLGIAFHWNGQWHVKTGGGFDSPEAIFATKFLRENVNTSNMDSDYTYCFEIIWLDDEYGHPLTHFYVKDELVLIGVISNMTGVELDTDALIATADRIGTRLAEIIEITDLKDIYNYAKSLPSNKEGVVVTTKSGFKFKIKGHEFLKLQKLFHGINKDYVIENFSGGKYTGAPIPEELTDILDYIKLIETKYEYALAESIGIADEMTQKFVLADRKLAWEWLCEHTKEGTNVFNGFIINLWVGMVGDQMTLPPRDKFDICYRKWLKEK